MLNPKTCPKCGGRMGPGYLLEFTDDNSRRATDWVEGEPEKGFLGTLKIKGHKRLPVVTYRCDRCAYLESYAPDV